MARRLLIALCFSILLATACSGLGLPVGARVVDAARASALADLAGGDLAARSRAIVALRELATAGDAESQHVFAVVHARGMTGTVDVRVANFWWRRAADQGFARAQYSYGQSLRLGRGLALDSKEAMRWTMLAAEQGHPIAQYDIGFAHTVGFGTPRDFAVALRWFEKSARAGHVLARAGLVRLYADESEAFYDPQQALVWLESIEPNRAMFAARAQGQMDAHRARIESRLSVSQRETALREAAELRERYPVLVYTYWNETFIEGLLPTP